MDTASRLGYRTGRLVAWRLRTQADGLILVSSRANSAGIKEAIASTPTVIVNRLVKGLPSVICDHTVALQEAAAHLVDMGHRKIALLSGPSSAWAAAERVQAVRAWARSVTDVEVIELGPFEAQFDDGRDAADDIITSGATAVLAFDDLMACGVLAGLAERGTSVPDDVSVVGCDDG